MPVLSRIPRLISASIRTRPSFHSLSSRSIETRPHSAELLANLYPHRCGIEAETLSRYVPGGYHPITLGEVLKDGRYKILHKVGYAHYSTSWVARDQEKDQYVVVRIFTSDVPRNRELQVMRTLSDIPEYRYGQRNVTKMLDQFTLAGPNGNHDCLVLELVGPSVESLVKYGNMGNRLPAKLAKSFALQAMRGLDLLATNDIGHGNLCVRNLAIDLPKSLNHQDESVLFEIFRIPITAPVIRLDHKPLTSHVPPYIVQPEGFQMGKVVELFPSITNGATVKIINFRESFLRDDAPSTLRTHLSARPPEIIFQDTLDPRVDMWSAGCLMFELITGQPLFGAWLLTRPPLHQQLKEFAGDGDALPPRWRAKWQEMNDTPTGQEEFNRIHGYLNKVYFDNEKPAEFSGQDITRASTLIAKMLQLEPSLRVNPSYVIANPWLNNRKGPSPPVKGVDLIQPKKTEISRGDTLIGWMRSMGR